jgi:hypothetical protein
MGFFSSFRSLIALARLLPKREIRKWVKSFYRLPRRWTAVHSGGRTTWVDA